MDKIEINNLVEEIKTKGSEKAFSKLYHYYYKTIWLTIYNIVKNKDIADDLISITFTKVYQKIESFVDNISFEMWIKTIAINTSIDYIRKMKNEKLNNYIDDEESTIQLNELSESPEDENIAKENVEIIMKALPKLRKRYRDLIQARIDGKSYKQISYELDIPESTLKSTLSKARVRLKEIINQLT